MLFDEVTLRKLNQLTLIAGRVRAGIMKGDRRSTKRGSSVEFADYRVYTAGDDLRRLDWNVYARLERPFIKLLEEEEDLAVHILIDRSRSMDWGEGETHKLKYGLRLAGALGAIALSTGDRLTISTLQVNGQAMQFGPSRGSQHLMRMLGFLEDIDRQPEKITAGETDLDYSLREYSLGARKPGLVFILSDLFSPAGFESGLNQLLGRGNEVVVLHILSPEEIEPPLAGDLRLVDIENHQAQEVSIDSGMRDLYRQRLLSWQAELSQNCRKHGARFLGISTSQPWDKFVLYEMRKAGMIK